MCEVTRKNFSNKYNEIIDKLQEATFIAVDCEFSGLFDNENKCSLFDSPKARFNKLQNSLENLIIVQFGLSTFKYERSNNSFSCSTYNFFIKPATAIGNQKFTCHTRSLEFLCKSSFDFNKLFYDGIYYLNKSSEKTALNMIEDGSLITIENASDIQKYCSRVAEWSGSALEGSEMELELSDESETFCYLLHQEIRKRFPRIWTEFGESNAIKIKKVKDSEKRLLLSNKDEEFKLKKKLFHSILGFSRIIKEIQSLKKPIIGHNILLDLIMIYKQFYNPSPISYKVFKKALSDIFPNVYDTKSISFRLRQILKRENVWNSNALSDLYNYLKDGKGANLVIYSPLVNHINKEFEKNERFHNAGFDSYVTGFCFLKMAHIFSLWDEKRQSFLLTSLPTSSSWLLGAVASMKNQVNISRGQVNHITLDGDDPKSVRPGLLYIKSKTNQPLDVFKISEIIAKYASVDIQILTKHSGLMAVSNQRQVQEILECFRNHEEYELTKFSFLRHSDLGRVIISVSFIATIAVTAICASKGLPKLKL